MSSDASIVEVKRYLQGENTTSVIDAMEFKDFWDSCTPEEKDQFKKDVGTALGR